jgi:hypothetical protein
MSNDIPASVQPRHCRRQASVRRAAPSDVVGSEPVACLLSLREKDV